MNHPAGPLRGVPDVAAFFEEITGSLAYIVSDPASGRAAVIDPVINYDPQAGRASTGFAERLCAHIAARGLTVAWHLETHIHADHLSAAPHMQSRFPAPLAIGERVTLVQAELARRYNAGPGFKPDGSHYDHLFGEGEAFALGAVEARVMFTPGHTPDSVSYRFGDAVFVGDSLFMPDYGTARCDFPGGGAAILYDSVQRLYGLADGTRLFVGHDYGTKKRTAPAWETTIGEQRRANVHIHEGVTETEFVALRQARDASLAIPALFHPAVQINMRAGQWPPAEDNGVHYLKIPLRAN